MICRTISLILQDFACFCRTILHVRQMLVGENCHWLAHSLGNGSALPTHWHPSCGWHWSWPTTILSQSNVYLVYALATWIISGTILNASRTAGCEVSFQDCPGNSGMVGMCFWHFERIFAYNTRPCYPYTWSLRTLWYLTKSDTKENCCFHLPLVNASSSVVIKERAHKCSLLWAYQPNAY